MLIDSHCHLPHTKYEKSLDELILEANGEGIAKFITIGTSLANNFIVKKLAESYPDIYFSVAIYPHEELDKSIEESLRLLEEGFLQERSSKLVAIGECGIDLPGAGSAYVESTRSLEDQLELFEGQIKLAIKYKLPLIIHNRNGNEIVMKLLQHYVPLGLKGVIHCFDADWGYAQKILDLGFYISFSGMVAYPKKEYLIEVVLKIPTTKFLVETDAPYLAPQSVRGQVNYPKYVKIVAEKVASIKNIPFSDIERFSYENTSKLFGI